MVYRWLTAVPPQVPDEGVSQKNYGLWQQRTVRRTPTENQSGELGREPGEPRAWLPRSMLLWVTESLATPRKYLARHRKSRCAVYAQQRAAPASIPCLLDRRDPRRRVSSRPLCTARPHAGL